jgi:hypothetical protein
MEGGSGEVCSDLLSLVELALWICAQEKRNVRSSKINKEEEELVDIAPHWGEPRISCVNVLGALLSMLFMCLFS